MEQLGKLLSTFAAGAAWFWSAIPAGIALGLHPILAGLAATLGNLTAVVLVVVLEERLRHWILGRNGSAAKHGERLKWLWDGYGLPGVALLSPLIMGAPLGTALALALGAPVRRLLGWMILSVALWGVGLTVAATLGLLVSRA